MLIQRYVPKSVFFHSVCDIDVYLFLSRLFLSFPFLRILYFTPLLFLRAASTAFSIGLTPPEVRRGWPTFDNNGHTQLAALASIVVA